MPAPELCAAMAVRAPYETREADNDFRDFRIGKVRNIDDSSGTVRIEFHHQYATSPAFDEVLDYPIDAVERCELLSGSPCYVRPSGSSARVLALTTDSLPPSQFAEYLVFVNGVVQRMSEADLVVASTHQRPDPFSQLRNYEFHHPSWRGARDPLVETYAELQNATLGLEDLIGSRVLLLPHQAEVVTRALSDSSCRFVLADEVGLGKTVEASVILKGLFRRDPRVKSLVVVPEALLRQWSNELNDKFWLEFSIFRSDDPLSPVLPEDWMDSKDHPGIIVSHEDLATDERIWRWLQQIDWGLLIVDEAHHIHRIPELQKRLIELSRRTPRSLVLSATPIERRAEEYLELLRLMDPIRYAEIDGNRFSYMLDAQARVREAVAFLTPSLTSDLFDVAEFEEELSSLADLLKDDEYLEESLRRLPEAAKFPGGELETAREILAHVSENYRIESRVIRNRRAHLTTELPQRALNTDFAYSPGDQELAAADALAEYVDLVRREVDSPLSPEYCRLLLHSLASSPHQLMYWLQRRTERLRLGVQIEEFNLDAVSVPGPPRDEESRIERLIHSLPQVIEEQDRLHDTEVEVERWLQSTDCELDRVSQRRALLASTSCHRLIQTLRAVDRALTADPRTKLVIFSTWQRTIDVLLPRLSRLFGSETVAEFRTGMDELELQRQIDEFQKNPRCRVLISDELGGEGRNLQVADQIVHIDLPWTPTRVEQRIGRVDRLGRIGVVLSVIPFAIGTLEHDLFRIWQDAFGLFTQSMSGLEIALEGVQDELQLAIGRSPRHGVADLFEQMRTQVAQLRREVEQERYFEAGAVNQTQRAEFRRLSDKYRDGELLQRVVMRWADMAGLRHDCDPITDVCTFSPRHFNQTSMANAKFFSPPNMEEAVRRSHHRYEHTLRGTFNRDVAVRREDLIFFAPGDDPWFDAIVNNALEADRGRCCGILRHDARVRHEWHGLDLCYTVQVDPRPLLLRGADPSHLYRAKGFLQVPSYRLLLSAEGDQVPRNDPLWRIVAKPFSRDHDVHIGKREGFDAFLDTFRLMYPPDAWMVAIDQLHDAARKVVAEEFDFTPDAADDARYQFAQQANRWRAVKRWMAREFGHAPDFSDVEEFEVIGEALAEGISRPLITLESVCFWIIKPGTATA